ncbi:porin [Brucella sp. 21LCYQ03]|nr:porin [Brucella sp. 21LCYQ03]
MLIKHLMMGSTAAIFTVSSALAADTIVAPEPESVEYVRVCDAYGVGYFYIPGTETCLRLHGFVRADITGGDNVYARSNARANRLLDTDFDERSRDTYDFLTRFSLQLSTASETELGTLKTFSQVRFQYENGKDSSDTGTLRYGYIQLGGLRVGLDESAFVTFPGFLGDVINDDVILAGGYRTNAISYTFTEGNGFSATLAVEQGGDSDTDNGTYTNLANGSQYTISGQIDDYTPHVVGGLKYAQGWGSIVGVVAYDSVNEDWAGKIRLDLNVTDQFSIWVMGGYKSNKDNYLYAYNDASGNPRGIRLVNSFYGTWGGDWAVWGGGQFKATDKAIFNLQLAYEKAETFAATANVAYELVPGFTITPEVSYTKWNDNKSVLKGDDAWQGMVRFQRTF